MNAKISRKKFLSFLLNLMIIPFIYLLGQMIKDDRKYKSAGKEIRITNPPTGLSINGPVIVSKTAEELKIFSAKCTHLGCLINKVENEEIICPCHGSIYNSDGIPVKGPSIKALEQLAYQWDETTNEIIIKLG